MRSTKQAKLLWQIVASINSLWSVIKRYGYGKEEGAKTMKKVNMKKN